MSNHIALARRDEFEIDERIVAKQEQGWVYVDRPIGTGPTAYVSLPAR